MVAAPSGGSYAKSLSVGAGASDRTSHVDWKASGRPAGAPAAASRAASASAGGGAAADAMT